MTSNDLPGAADSRADVIERELTEFSYIVSHDLAAPCRHLSHFSQLLLRDMGGKLTDSQRSYGSQIQAAGEKCQAMLEQLILFSRAKAMAKDSNDQWVIRYDIQVKTIDKMLDEFINYARLDVGRWKLLRYGATPQPAAQAASATATPSSAAAPKPPRPKAAKSGSSHIGDYAPGTPMFTIFERLKGGKVIDKKDLYAGLGGSPHTYLAWVKIHGTKSGKWTVKTLPGDKYQMVMS